MDLHYWRGITHPQTTQYMCNTPRLPQKYIGFHNLKCGRVMHSLTKTYKQSNTLLRLFNKNHGLNYFNLNYQSDIAYGKEYSMNMHYPSQGIQKIH
jgi:hypothetical protein